MTREDIEKAARIEREKIHKELQECYKKHKDINLYTAFSATIDKYAVPLFKTGAAWRINSMWHSASEVPEKKPALVEYSHFPKGHGYLVVPDPREVLGSITRYAYIEDLIPNTKE